MVTVVRLIADTRWDRLAATVALVIFLALALARRECLKFNQPPDQRRTPDNASYGGEPTSVWATHCQRGHLDEETFISPGNCSFVWLYLPGGKFGAPKDEHTEPCMRLIEGEPTAYALNFSRIGVDSENFF
jgi:hypothetical protein